MDQTTTMPNVYDCHHGWGLPTHLVYYNPSFLVNGFHMTSLSQANNKAAFLAFNLLLMSLRAAGISTEEINICNPMPRKQKDNKGGDGEEVSF